MHLRSAFLTAIALAAIFGVSARAQSYVIVTIPNPAGDTIQAVSPFSPSGVNANNQITGYATSPARAFIGAASGSTVIPLPAGWPGGSVGDAINDVGQVTGYAHNPSTGNPDQVFIGITSGSTPVPIPAGLKNI
jgi:hypothetical protein